MSLLILYFVELVQSPEIFGRHNGLSGEKNELK